MSDLRWQAVITYRSMRGDTDIDYQFEELEEIHNIVEKGPDWNCIKKIEIKLTRNLDPKAIMEETMRLSND